MSGKMDAGGWMLMLVLALEMFKLRKRETLFHQSEIVCCSEASDFNAVFQIGNCIEKGNVFIQ